MGNAPAACGRAINLAASVERAASPVSARARGCYSSPSDAANIYNNL